MINVMSREQKLQYQKSLLNKNNQSWSHSVECGEYGVQSALDDPGMVFSSIFRFLCNLPLYLKEHKETLSLYGFKEEKEIIYKLVISYLELKFASSSTYERMNLYIDIYNDEFSEKREQGKLLYYVTEIYETTKQFCTNRKVLSCFLCFKVASSNFSFHRQIISDSGVNVQETLSYSWEEFADVYFFEQPKKNLKENLLTLFDKRYSTNSSCISKLAYRAIGTCRKNTIEESYRTKLYTFLLAAEKSIVNKRSEIDSRLEKVIPVMFTSLFENFVNSLTYRNQNFYYKTKFQDRNYAFEYKHQLSGFFETAINTSIQQLMRGIYSDLFTLLVPNERGANIELPEDLESVIDTTISATLEKSNDELFTFRKKAEQ